MASAASPGHVYAVVLLDVLSGGVLTIRCNHRHRRRCQQRVRLHGVQLPPSRSPAGKEARAFTEAWIRQHTRVWPNPGLLITLIGPPPPHTRRTTYIARIHAPDGAALDQDLVAAGVGVWANRRVGEG